MPGGMADSDLEAREQRIADYRLCLGNAPLPAWGPFLLDRRPRTKTFAGFASGRLTLPKHAGGPGSKSSRGLPVYLPRERSALLRLGPAFFTTRFTSAFDLPVIEGGGGGWGKMRTTGLSQLRAFSRN